MKVVPIGKNSTIDGISVKKDSHDSMKSEFAKWTSNSRPNHKHSKKKNRKSVVKKFSAIRKKVNEFIRKQNRTQGSEKSHIDIKSIVRTFPLSREYSAYHLVYRVSRVKSIKRRKREMVSLSYALRWFVLVALLTHSFQSLSQRTENDSLHVRKTVLLASGSTLMAASYVGLNSLWYKDYPRSSFHYFNDNSEWLQMDKCGHMMSSYTLGSLGYHSMKWSGFNENKSLFIGGSLGLIYLTGIEILDGFSSQWGFSWGDEIANFSGTSLFILQQKFWKEQRITMKFSYSNSTFANQNPELLGRNFQQRLLKDYNAQTYWASFNVSSFLASDAAFPKFLNIAFGYGATGMTRAKNVVDSVNNFQREREFYLSFDADLNQVRWPKKWMKKTARILSFIKLPSPTLKMQSDGKVKLYALFF